MKKGVFMVSCMLRSRRGGKEEEEEEEEEVVEGSTCTQATSES
jgi:hypothetical protein